MRLQILFFLFFATYLTAQDADLDASAIAKDSFPVRLTKEEQQMQNGNGCCPPSPQQNANGCCPTPSNSACCPQPCTPPPSINCPPLHPYCNPCDCIIDYYNPLIFNGFDLSVEWLFWKVQQKSSTFALTPNGIHQPFPPSTVSDAIGKYRSASFDWNSGLRAGLSYTFVRDAWNLLGQYTFYQTSGSDTANRPDTQTLYVEPTNRALSNDGVDQLKSRTKFCYQAADLLLARRFLPGCQIIFNFFSGATTAWIHEKWKVTGFDSAAITTTTKNNWSFSGGGLRAGLDANWHMGGGFGLFNKCSFAALVGSYKNSRKTHLDPEGVIVGIIPTLIPNIRNTTEKETWVVPNTQIEFGLNWNHRFCSWAMMLQAALEINTWYDLHQLHQDGFQLNSPNTDRLDIRNASPVNLWGISAKANFSF